MSLVAPPTSAPIVRKAASKALGREPVESAAGATIFALPDAAAMAHAPKLFSYIEAIQKGDEYPGIELTDWGISHTTLEDVFVSLARGGDENTKGRKVKKDLFKATLELCDADWAPGQPFPFVARDGVEYVVPAEMLPSKKAWKNMSNNDTGVVMHEVRLERKQRNLARLLASTPGTRLVRLFKSHRMDVVGISLHGTPEDPPLVCKVKKGGLASRSRRLFAGDELIAINGTPTVGHEATRLRLAAGVGELYLSVRRSAEGRGEKEQRSMGGPTQLFALLSRTLRVQGRQRVQACLALLVPLACILMVVGIFSTIAEGEFASQSSDALSRPLMRASLLPLSQSPRANVALHSLPLSVGTAANLKASVERLQEEARFGCANASDLLLKACTTGKQTINVGNEW